MAHITPFFKIFLSDCSELRSTIFQKKCGIFLGWKKFRGEAALMAGKFITIIYNEKKKRSQNSSILCFFQTLHYAIFYLG